MTEGSPDGVSGGPSQRSVEIGVAVCAAIFALVIIVGSVEAGIGWGLEGPKAGFFPFYVGLLILVSSVVNFVNIGAKGTSLFADWAQLRQVMSVLVPTAVYVAVIPFIGIYVASVVLIAFFMRWLGRYDWITVALISVGVPLITFVVFESWFLVPLPKGALEAYLGY